jgi:hypothetical protein
MNKWNPETHPYIVWRFRRINNPQLYNWICDSTQHETIELARAEFSRLVHGTIRVQLFDSRGNIQPWKLLQERRTSKSGSPAPTGQGGFV